MPPMFLAKRKVLASQTFHEHERKGWKEEHNVNVFWDSVQLTCYLVGLRRRPSVVHCCWMDWCILGILVSSGWSEDYYHLFSFLTHTINWRKKTFFIFYFLLSHFNILFRKRGNMHKVQNFFFCFGLHIENKREEGNFLKRVDNKGIK